MIFDVSSINGKTDSAGQLIAKTNCSTAKISSQFISYIEAKKYSMFGSIIISFLLFEFSLISFAASIKW